MDLDAIIINKEDNVATALQDLKTGQIARARLNSDIIDVMIAMSIPYGHKFAVKNIVKGEPIIKYGEIIGSATENIFIGEHAHIQNIESKRGRGDLSNEV